MGHEDKRRERKEFLIDNINFPKSFKSAWEESRLISLACLKFDAGKRYIKEIVQDLLNTKIAFKIDKKIMNYQIFQEEMSLRKL